MTKTFSSITRSAPFFRSRGLLLPVTCLSVVDPVVDTLRMSIEGIDTEQSNWQRSANCRLAPSYVFFPEETLKPGFKPIPGQRGLTYQDFCGSCRVRARCLEYALLHDLDGIWGNTTFAERKNRFSTFEREEMREYKAEIGAYKPLYGHS